MPSYELDLHKFEGYNTQVLGISVDHIPCLQAWAESLGGISYPLLSDFWPHGAVAQEYGVLIGEEGKSERALFIVDKEGIVRYVDIHDIDDQPDNEEVFEVLQQLEPDAVIPEKGEDATPEPAPVAAGEKPKSVILYCRPGCIDCRLARRFLERNGIAYTEINVRVTPEAETRVREWTGGALVSPVFDVDGTIIIDFKRRELSEVLGLD
jgi:arsenate reductase-like glutaredoxin family protein